MHVSCEQRLVSCNLTSVCICIRQRQHVPGYNSHSTPLPPQERIGRQHMRPLSSSPRDESGRQGQAANLYRSWAFLHLPSSPYSLPRRGRLLLGERRVHHGSRPVAPVAPLSAGTTPCAQRRRGRPGSLGSGNVLSRSWVEIKIIRVVPRHTSALSRSRTDRPRPRACESRPSLLSINSADEASWTKSH